MSSEQSKAATAKRREQFFIDTEFIENGPSFPLILISIGIVCADGREFYAVNGDAPLELANDWVKKNVIPHLGGPKLSIRDLPNEIKAFIGDCKPEFWGYYADYDWVVFCQLFGTMIDLPKGWPMFCRDIKQLCVDRGDPKLPEQLSTEHNALNDARWNKTAYDFLSALDSAGVRELQDKVNHLQFELSARDEQIKGLVADNEKLITQSYNAGFSDGAKLARAKEGL